MVSRYFFGQKLFTLISIAWLLVSATCYADDSYSTNAENEATITVTPTEPYEQSTSPDNIVSQASSSTPEDDIITSTPASYTESVSFTDQPTSTPTYNEYETSANPTDDDDDEPTLDDETPRYRSRTHPKRSDSEQYDRSRRWLDTFWGTNWCGDYALRPQDGSLGKFYQTDGCCKQHKICTQTALNSLSYGILNQINAREYRDCDCDFYFRQCLKAVRPIYYFFGTTDKHNKVGEYYFNYIAPTCIATLSPIVRCDRWHSRNGMTRCQSYILDHYYSARPQIVDNIFFNDY